MVFANPEEEIVRQVRDSRADVAIFHARPGSSDAFVAAAKVRLAKDLAGVACLVVHPASMADRVEERRLEALGADAYLSEPVTPEALSNALAAARAHRANPVDPAATRRWLLLGALFVQALGMLAFLAPTILAKAAPQVQLGAWAVFTAGSGMELLARRRPGRLRWGFFLFAIVLLVLLLWTSRGS
ncbi:MAG TPA: hypothetical protein VLT61_03710 [Anaeromyxobacteraceae bacterium]|nr:hypothetical protein [Anaeromyxobacteraceae bacterium]